MAENKTEVKKWTGAALKKLARLEIRFPEESEEKAMETIPVKRPYAASPEDLLAAVEKARTMPPEELKSGWFEPLRREGESLFHLFEKDFWGMGTEDYRGLPGEDWLTAGIWSDMILQGLERGEADWDLFKARLEDLIRMRRIPVPMRNYGDDIKEQYIDYYGDDARLREASEKEVLLYVLYTDELVSKNNVTALWAKARGCFGGDKAYACSWSRARDLFLRLLEQEEAEAAAMLGHIYYQGRTNQGKAEWDKAFYYYSIGALWGSDEAALRLADMFQRGEGVPRNKGIAQKLVQEQYRELLPFAAEGFFANRFPEAAWRMGELFRKQEEVSDWDIREAQGFYLKASLALEERKKIRYGEAEMRLEEDIRHSLAAVEGKAQPGKGEKRMGWESVLRDILNLYGKGSCYRLSFQERSGGKKAFSLTRINRMTEKESPMLVTLPEAEYCDLTDKLKGEISSIRSWEAERTLGDTILFDEWDPVLGFLREGKPVLRFEADVRLKLSKKKKTTDS